MNRRGFFGWVAGLFGTKYAGERPELSYTYSWDMKPGPNAPWTNDPVALARSPLPPLGCPPNRVWLNGVEVAHRWHIFELKTGPGGYVKTELRGPAGEPLTEFWDNWAGEWVTWFGHPHPDKFHAIRDHILKVYGVELKEEQTLAKETVWQQMRDMVDKDGNLRLRWGEERVLQRTFYGHVRYECEGVA